MLGYHRLNLHKHGNSMTASLFKSISTEINRNRHSMQVFDKNDLGSHKTAQNGENKLT